MRGHAAAAVTEMADRLHIPVVNTMMAKGIIPMDDKYSLWTIGIPQKDYVNQVFDRTDLIPTLEEAFRQTVPSVIVVPVDYSENMKLSTHLKEVYQQSEE